MAKIRSFRAVLVLSFALAGSLGRGEDLYVVTKDVTQLHLEPNEESEVGTTVEAGEKLKVVSVEHVPFLSIDYYWATMYVDKDKVEESPALLQALREEEARKARVAEQQTEAAEQQAKVDARVAKWKEEFYGGAKKKREQRRAELIEKYGEDVGSRIADGKVWVGMTTEQAIDSWGKPEDVNVTTTASTRREQWVYGPGRYLYFTNGKLEAVQR